VLAHVFLKIKTLLRVRAGRACLSLFQAGEIPKPGDVLVVDRYAFTVVEADERRIITVSGNCKWEGLLIILQNEYIVFFLKTTLRSEHAPAGFSLFPEHAPVGGCALICARFSVLRGLDQNVILKK
jgi:hypothetical protein